MTCKSCLLVGLSTMLFLLTFLLVASLLDAVYLSLSILHTVSFICKSIKTIFFGAKHSKRPTQTICLWGISSSPLLFSLSSICHVTSFHMIIILILSSPFVLKYLKIPDMTPSRCEEAFLIQTYITLLYLKNTRLFRFPSSLNYVLCYGIGTENLI